MSVRTRVTWLRMMYAGTIVVAGSCGLGILTSPQATAAFLGLPTQEPIAFGMLGSVFVAFAILSALGLRAPLKFAPVLLMQLCYKSIWLVSTVFPAMVRGQYPAGAVVTAIAFLLIVIGDLVAVPFADLLPHRAGIES